MKQPLVAPLTALTIGVAVSQLAVFSFAETLLSVVLLGALALLGVRTGVFRAGFLACLSGFFVCGVMLGSRPDVPDPRLVDRVWIEGRDEVDDPVRLRGWVRRPAESLDYGDRFVLEVETVFSDSAAQGGVQVIVYRGTDDPVLDLARGTRVELLARLRKPRNFQNPGSFDYVGYLQSRRIFLTASVRAGTPIHRLDGRGGSLWLSWVWSAREAAERRLAGLFADHDSDRRVDGILRALLLGERTGLSRQTREDFQRTGAYHALVISGLHVGAMAFAVLFLLRWVMVPATARTLITIVLIVAYVFFVGAALPVMRAAWMCSAYLVSTLIYRQRRALNMIAGTALVFLLIDPSLLFDASFQMSFLAVALIAGVGVPLLETTVEPYRRALIDLWNEDRDLHLDPRVAQLRVALRMWLEPLPVLTRLPRRLITGAVVGCLRIVIWVAALFVVSAVIQAGLTLPMAAHFQRVSWGGVLANLCVMPLLLVTLPLGLLALLTNSTLLGTLTWSCAQGISSIVGWFATELPVDLRVPPPPFWLAALFGLALVGLSLSFGRALRWRVAAWSLFAVSLTLLVVHPFTPRVRPGHFEFTAIDVGQGESLFLALPDGHTVLVDGGGLPDFGGTRTLDIGDAVVSPYLWSRSIRRLDVLAVTHSDADHFAGVPALLENFAIGEIWLSRAAFGDEHRDWIDTVTARGITVKSLQQGDRLSIGDVVFDVLGPAPEAALDGLRENNRSLVLSASFGQHRFLLTGDIEARAEERLVNGPQLRESDVLKVAHHGSATSTQDEFLDRVAPTFAVVSAGFRNPFGHPHPSVLERLTERGVRVLRTDVEGLISVLTDGRRLSVETFRRQRAIKNRPGSGVRDLPQGP